jgi:hypothetical protein
LPLRELHRLRRLRGHRSLREVGVGGRALRGIRDLFGVSWLLKRQIRFPVGLLDASVSPHDRS